MKAVTLPPGSRGIDTVEKIDAAYAAWLKAHGFDFVVRYITSLTAEEIQTILSAGLALGLVTYAHSYDPADELAALKRLGIPAGVHLFLDIEDDGLDHVALAQRINTWSRAIKPTGVIPAGYIGSGNPCTSTELYALGIYAYWHSCSRVVDRDGREAAPSCGWVMHQLVPGNYLMPNLNRTVDLNVIQRDYKGREVVFVGAG